MQFQQIFLDYEKMQQIGIAVFRKSCCCLTYKQKTVVCIFSLALLKTVLARDLPTLSVSGQRSVVFLVIFLNFTSCLTIRPPSPNNFR